MWRGSVRPVSVSPVRPPAAWQPDPEPWDVRSLAATYRSGHRLPAHGHGWAQLVFARTGVMHVTAEGQVWLVPPTRAVWIPAGVQHGIEFRGEVALRTLYIAPARAASIVPSVNDDGVRPATDRGVHTLEVSPLLAALILHVLSLGMLDPGEPPQDRLAGVLTDLLAAAPRLDLALPLPTDPRALRFADLLRADPGARHDLDALAAHCGASLRTIQRHVLEQTGMPLDSWRQKARLTHSVALLAAGNSVAAAARDSGYDSPSAFTAAFRAHFGVPPRQFARPAR